VTNAFSAFNALYIVFVETICSGTSMP